MRPSNLYVYEVDNLSDRILYDFDLHNIRLPDVKFCIHFLYLLYLQIELNELNAAS